VGRLAVRVQPGASRDQLLGSRDGVLIIRVSAPAQEGRANAAVCKMLAKRLGVPASRVSVARGQRSREKLIEVDGIDQDELSRRAASAADSTSA
jgi:uncharacterized protein (TIGR00251 family)